MVCAARSGRGCGGKIDSQMKPCYDKIHLVVFSLVLLEFSGASDSGGSSGGVGTAAEFQSEPE